MKILRKQFAVSALCLATLAFSPSCRNSDQQPHFLFNLPSGNDWWTLQFPAVSSSEIYKDSMTAVAILSVVCDGIAITPNVATVNAVPRLSTVRPNANTVVYRMSAMHLSCWEKIDSGGSAKMKKFSLPATARLIEINYEVRLPNGRISAVQKVTFVRSEEATPALVVPNGAKRNGSGVNGA